MLFHLFLSIFTFCVDVFNICHLFVYHGSESLVLEIISCVCIVCVLGAGMLNADCRGQHLNTEDLLENEEEEAEENEVQVLTLKHST